MDPLVIPSPPLVCSVLMYWDCAKRTVDEEFPDVRRFPVDTPEERQTLMDLLMADKRIRRLYQYGPPGHEPPKLLQYLWRSGMNGSFANLPVQKEAWEVLDRIDPCIAGCPLEGLVSEHELLRALFLETTTKEYLEHSRQMMRVTEELCGDSP